MSEHIHKTIEQLRAEAIQLQNLAQQLAEWVRANDQRQTTLPLAEPPEGGTPNGGNGKTAVVGRIPTLTDHVLMAIKKMGGSEFGSKQVVEAMPCGKDGNKVAKILYSLCKRGEIEHVSGKGRNKRYMAAGLRAQCGPLGLGQRNGGVESSDLGRRDASPEPSTLNPQPSTVKKHRKMRRAVHPLRARVWGLMAEAREPFTIRMLKLALVGDPAVGKARTPEIEDMLNGELLNARESGAIERAEPGLPTPFRRTATFAQMREQFVTSAEAEEKARAEADAVMAAGGNGEESGE